MSIVINGSNSLENLALQLSRELKKQQNHVFQPQYIITQTEGMNNWLKIKMAEHLGIVANCKLLKPNDLISEIYFKLGANTRQTLSPGTLQWVLFTLLGSKDFQDRFREIANYYTNNDVKRMALSVKTADLFDQYQVYRPEMIRKWNEGGPDGEGKNGWQNYLWVKSKDILGDSMPDKTVVGRHIMESLKQPEQQKKLASLIPNIHVFGLSIITVYHVQLFYELARVINVSIHLLNPSPSVYWQEDKSEKQLAIWKQKSNGKGTDLRSTGNGLLTSWGRVLQDTFALFFASDDLIDQYNEVGAEEPAADTLLGKIQNDIFYNLDAESRNRITAADMTDGSVTINSCYTIAREVEVLYNYLVHLVAKQNESLSPRDIVVMISDIDAYAPYIKAVFHAAPFKFPFTIADESFTISDNLFSALQSVLALTEETANAEAVLQLLESNLIRSRFGITDLDLIRKAVDAANIRFGFAGNQEDDTMYVSWRNGINRIMYGICMSGGEEYMIDGLATYPLDMIEGVEAFELIRFCHFAEVLISTIEDRKHARTLSEWGEYIEQVVDKLVCPAEDNSDDDYPLLLKNLERLYLLNEMVKETISFEVFKHSFVNSLSAESRSSTFASGGITFCSLIPMRSIPFKVVALLGLDFDKFPRKESRVSFNIMEQEKKRRGDRNVKENDKHLFLETILSAQKYLYISFLGRSSKDNTPRPPSVLIDELTDYIQSGIEDEEVNVREKLVTIHPLHGFSQKYEHTPGLYTYLGESTPKEESKATGAKTADGSILFDEVSMGAFISFFKNPFKAYYNHVLGIRYQQDDVLLPENEVFEVESLLKWQIKQDMLFLEQGQLEPYRRKGVATGKLPLKHMADYVLARTETDIETVKQQLSERTGEAPKENVNIECEVDGTFFKGTLNHVYDNRHILVSFSKKESKYLVEAHLKSLLAAASGHPVEVNFISAETRSVFTIPGNRRTQEAARSKLRELLGLYKRGHEQILMFYPNFNKAPRDIEAMTREKFESMLGKFFKEEHYDEYIDKAYAYGFFKDPNVYEEYKRNSRLIYSDEAEFYAAFYST